MIGLIPISDILDFLSEDADLDDGYTVADTLDAKRARDDYPKLLDSVRRDGITVPVLIRTLEGIPWLADGHHRIAAALDSGLDTIAWTDVPLDVEQSLQNPYMKSEWGPYRPSPVKA